MFGIKKSTDEATVHADEQPAAEAMEQPSDDLATTTLEPTTSQPVAIENRFFKQAPTPILKPSILSEGFELIGDIKSSGGLHVEGKIEGKVHVDNLTIGAKGTVTGSVICASLSIKGGFNGEAICDSLILSGNAIVHGDIEYRNLTMASGTILTGNLKKT